MVAVCGCLGYVDLVESCGVVLGTVPMREMVHGSNHGGVGGSYRGNEDEKGTGDQAQM